VSQRNSVAIREGGMPELEFHHQHRIRVAVKLFRRTYSFVSGGHNSKRSFNALEFNIRIFSSKIERMNELSALI